MRMLWLNICRGIHHRVYWSFPFALDIGNSIFFIYISLFFRYKRTRGRFEVVNNEKVLDKHSHISLSWCDCHGQPVELMTRKKTIAWERLHISQNVGKFSENRSTYLLKSFIRIGGFGYLLWFSKRTRIYGSNNFFIIDELKHNKVMLNYVFSRIYCEYISGFIHITFI